MTTTILGWCSTTEVGQNQPHPDYFSARKRARELAALPAARRPERLTIWVRYDAAAREWVVFSTIDLHELAEGPAYRCRDTDERAATALAVVRAEVDLRKAVKAGTDTTAHYERLADAEDAFAAVCQRTPGRAA